MINWLSALVPIALVCYISVRLVLKPILAITTTPKDDLTRIKANLEGPAGEAGPSMHIVAITRAGHTLPSRARDSERSYLVTLRRLDGTIQQRTVQIEVAIFGQGEMSVGRMQQSSPPRQERKGTASTPELKGLARSVGWWQEIRSVLGVALALAVAGVVLVAFSVLPALPFISGAKEQLRLCFASQRY